MYIKLAESQHKTEEQRRSHEKKLEELEIRFAESQHKTEEHILICLLYHLV